MEGSSPAQQPSVQLGTHPHASSDNPGTAAQLQFSPRQAARPSLIATAAIAKPAIGSSHHQPQRLFVTNPARTAAAKYAHSRFCIPSPAVAPEPRRTPKRCLAMPRAGISRMLLIVSPIPSNVESARCWVIRSRTDPVATYGASMQKLMATAFWALPSAVSERVRAPVNLQMTMTLAKPSTPDDRAQPTSAMDPAANPATSPTAPSIVIQPRLAHPGLAVGKAAHDRKSCGVRQRAEEGHSRLQSSLGSNHRSNPMISASGHDFDGLALAGCAFGT